MKETVLYIIRHAQSHPSSSQYHTEWPLSAVGQQQALTLSNLLDYLIIDKIYSSPFIRCKQTIEPFAKREMLDIIVENDLRERLISIEIIDGFYEVWCKSWGNFEYSLPGCESSADAQKRFVQIIKKIVDLNQGKTIAISTHGNVIGLFLNWIDNTLGKKEAEMITNPDVLKVVVKNSTYHWDIEFLLPGIKEISTDYKETKID